MSKQQLIKSHSTAKYSRKIILHVTKDVSIHGFVLDIDLTDVGFYYTFPFHSKDFALRLSAFYNQYESRASSGSINTELTTMTITKRLGEPLQKLRVRLDTCKIDLSPPVILY